MRLSEYQAQYLLQCLRDTLIINSDTFTWKVDQRQAMYQRIIMQQSDKLIELESHNDLLPKSTELVGS